MSELDKVAAASPRPAWDDRGVVMLQANVLIRFLTEMFVAAGCSPQNASIMAEAVTEADLRGHRIQGTDHLYSTIRDLKKGILRGKAIPSITVERAGMAVVDGHGAPGHVAGRFASELAIRKAREAGTASVALLDAGDIFMLGYYVSLIAEAGLVGMIFTNTWPPRVHPFGGIDKILGTNPLAIGIPANEGSPVVLDMATSATAVGHVRIASYYNAAIPEGLAIDEDGDPTIDPHAALAGALSPLGGHKGYGLGLCVGLLAGPVIGGVVGTVLDKVAGDGDRDAGVRAHLFMALDPAAFGDPEAARRNVTQFLAEIRGSRKAANSDEILIPGQRAFETRRRYLETGLPILKETWDRTLQLARDLGVADPLA